MGLDMYMNKTKKIDGMTVEEIIETNNYIDYLNRPEEYISSSFKKWCGGNIDNVRQDKIEEVKANIHKCYGVWDTEKRYGYDSVFDGIAYWRKANAIHKWFVDNCGDGVDECQIMELSKEHLELLLDTAKKVKNSCKLIKGKIQNGYTYKEGKEIPNIVDGEYIEDPSVAKELLPTTSGFFFGGTNYDKWYLEDINYTIEQIEKILETTDFNNEFVVYQASW